MQQARSPTVLPYPCSHSRFWHGLFNGLRGLACLGVLCWVLMDAPDDAPWLRLTLAGLACLCIAWAGCRAVSQGLQLGLDPDRGWWLAPLADPTEARAATAVVHGHLDVALDLGPAMLLRFRAPCDAGRPVTHWLAIDRTAAPAAWQALRRAVYSARFAAHPDTVPADPAIHRATR